VYQSATINRRILEVVNRGDYVLGPECRAFENELAAYIGVKHAVLCSSWTAGVLLLHMAQELGSENKVLVPSLTAFATIEPMTHAGVRPIFCDIDETYTIDLADARRRITSKTVGVMAVHPYGRPANIDGILELAREHGLWVVEDCAQSIGATWNGQRLGTFGTHSAFSFYPSKNLTVYGDGGAIATNDSETAARIVMLRNHGRKCKYVHELVGFNLRFNEIQAAVGREHLKVIDQLNSARRRVAQWYRRELVGVEDMTLPPPDPDGAQAVYHLFVIRLADHDQRQSLARHLKKHGIETGIHYPVANHQQAAIEQRFGRQESLPRTEQYVKRILSLPMYPKLEEAHVHFIADQIKTYLARR